MSTLTKVFVGLLGGATALAQTSWAQGLLAGHTRASSIVAGLLALLSLLYNPAVASKSASASK